MRVCVAAKKLQLLADIVVDSTDVLVVVKASAAIGGKVVDGSVMVARGVCLRQQSQNTLRGRQSRSRKIPIYGLQISLRDHVSRVTRWPCHGARTRSVDVVRVINLSSPSEPRSEVFAEIARRARGVQTG